MPWKVIRNLHFSPVELQTTRTLREAEAWLRARCEEELRTAAVYASPLAVRRIKSRQRIVYGIIKVKDAA